MQQKRRSKERCRISGTFQNGVRETFEGRSRRHWFCRKKTGQKHGVGVVSDQPRKWNARRKRCANGATRQRTNLELNPPLSPLERRSTQSRRMGPGRISSSLPGNASCWVAKARSGRNTL